MMRLLDGAKAKNWQSCAARLTVTCLIAVGLEAGAPCGDLSALAQESGAQVAGEANEASSRIVKPSVSFMELPSSQLAVVLRPREMTRSLSFGPLVSVAQPFVQEQFESALGSIKNKPQVRFDAIEYIVCSLRPNAANGGVASESALEKGAWQDVTFELAIRFTAPTDCAAWTAAELPGAERMECDGLACVRIKMGDSPDEVLYLIQRDPFTAAATSDVRRLKQLAKEDDAGTPDAESEVFESDAIACTADASALALSGSEDFQHQFSALALFIPREGAYTTSEQPDPVVAAKRAFADGVRRVTVGIGVHPASDKLAWRVVFNCVDQPAAADVQKGVEMFQGVATAMVDVFDKQLETAIPEDEASRAEAIESANAMAFTSRLLSTATISQRSIRSADDSIVLESSGVLPKLLPALLGVHGEAFYPPTAPAESEPAGSVQD